MIITRQPRIPFSWLLMAMVPWVFFYFMPIFYSLEGREK